MHTGCTFPSRSDWRKLAIETPSFGVGDRRYLLSSPPLFLPSCRPAHGALQRKPSLPRSQIMVVPPRYRQFLISLSLDPSPDCNFHPQYGITCSIDRRSIRRRSIRRAYRDGSRKLDVWRLAGTDVHFGSTARSLQDVCERVIRHRVCYLDLSVMLFLVLPE